jgi:hypothetical protein
MLSPVTGAWLIALVPLDDEAVGRQALVRLDDRDVADRQLLDRDFPGLPVAPYQSRSRREFSQRLDGTLGAAHRIMLERMAEAEQEQQQRAFGPGAQRGGAGGSDQHQRVDLEPLHAEVVDRLAQREIAAQTIGQNVGRHRYPGRSAGELFDAETDRCECAAHNGEDYLGVCAEYHPAMRVIMALAFFASAMIMPLMTLFIAMSMAGMGVGSARRRGR